MSGTTHPVAQFHMQEGLNPHYKSTGKMWLAKSFEDRGPTLKVIFCVCVHILSCARTHAYVCMHARTRVSQQTHTHFLIINRRAAVMYFN